MIIENRLKHKTLVGQTRIKTKIYNICEDSLQANHDRDENLINGATEVIPPFEGGQISIKPK